MLRAGKFMLIIAIESEYTLKDKSPSNHIKDTVPAHTTIACKLNHRKEFFVIIL